MTDKECFICCSKSGKSIEEKLMDNIHHKKLRYPLIPLSYAYDCNCKNIWCHNKCLKTIFKCPTCRKGVIKPNLCVRSYIDKYLNLEWIRNNPTKFKKIKTGALLIMFVIIILNLLNEHKYIIIENLYVLCAFIFIMLLSSMILFVDDYIEKYWLYDAKLNRFY